MNETIFGRLVDLAIAAIAVGLIAAAVCLALESKRQIDLCREKQAMRGTIALVPCGL